MRPVRSEVLVVGAGPAGSTLALRLARAGIAVCVVEALHFPRPKPCGEFLDPAAVECLAELGLCERLVTAGARRIAGLRLHAGAHSAVGRYRGGASGLALRREELDQRLLDAALESGRVELSAGWRVHALLRAGDGRVQGVVARRGSEERRFEARFVVGADGPHSVVARELGARSGADARASRAPRPERIAFVARFAGALVDELADAWLCADGFVGAAPVEDGDWSVGLVVASASFEASGLDATHFYEQRLAAVGGIARRLAGAIRLDPVRGRGPLAVPSTRAVVDGALLVGDAAGFVDPLTGEGLYHALRGARLCADALIGVLRQGADERAALAGYARRRLLELGPRRVLARLALAASLRPGMVLPAVALGARVPLLASALVELVGRAFPRTSAPLARAAAEYGRAAEGPA